MADDPSNRLEQATAVAQEMWHQSVAKQLQALHDFLSDLPNTTSIVYQIVPEDATASQPLYASWNIPLAEISEQNREYLRYAGILIVGNSRFQEPLVATIMAKTRFGLELSMPR
jgi:hypothetical protein